MMENHHFFVAANAESVIRSDFATTSGSYHSQNVGFVLVGRLQPCLLGVENHSDDIDTVVHLCEFGC